MRKGKENDTPQKYLLISTHEDNMFHNRRVFYFRYFNKSMLCLNISLKHLRTSKKCCRL